MCTGKILILALVSILEIASSKIPIKQQTLLWSPFLRYPKSPAVPPDEISHVAEFRNSPKKNFPNVYPTKDHRYRGKNNYPRLDPIEYKKLRSTKVSKYPRNVKRKYPTYDLPSPYLEPPKKTSSDDRYYEKSVESLEDRKKEKIHNATVDSPKNHKFEDEIVKDKNYDDEGSIYAIDQAPEQRVEATNDKEGSDSEESSVEKIKDSPGGSKDRIEYHIHGHAGPETYMFGFDTGEGESRQYRMEERHGDGTITGHYGYIDARGKLRKVKYKASPTHGYEEKHHETNEQDS